MSSRWTAAMSQLVRRSLGEGGTSRNAHYVSNAFRAGNGLRLGFATAALRRHQPPSFIRGSVKMRPKATHWQFLAFLLSAKT
jgi:hypothetical protein